MQGPESSRGEAQVKRVAAAGHPRDFELHRDAPAPGRARLVALAAERQALDRHLELQPPPLAGRQAQRREVELGCERGQRLQASGAGARAPGVPAAYASSRLRILPVALRGSCSRNTTSRGTLKRARLPLT